jgi:Ni/Co efflux regulator RcnB
MVFVLLAGGMAMAEEHHEEQHARPPAPHGEPFAGPKRYQVHGEPEGVRNRPVAAEPGEYRHNFQAARAFHIGPYHRPPGWEAHHWGYGQILPRAYWGPEYFIADYWLFGLPVPPVGFEWVRDDDDAILVNTATGEILQVQYGVYG